MLLRLRITLATIALFFATTELHGQSPTVVSGIVLSASSNTPIAGALLTARNRTVISDSLGRFRLVLDAGGAVELRVSHQAFAARVLPFDIATGDSLSLYVRLAARNVQLDRIVVTASERKVSAEGSTVTSIGRDAIEHVQASSLADVLQLVPGQAAVNPTLSGVRQSLLRQAPTGTSRDPGPGTEAERANALGTSVVIDGVPVSNNANLQTNLTILNSGPNALPAFASTAGRGSDLRQFAADNIESVEVVRGIPGVRHGDLTAGAILVTSRAGAQQPELRVRANPLTVEMSSVAGWGDGKRSGLSVDANIVSSQDDPRSTMDRFARYTAQVAWSRALTSRLHTTIRARGYSVADDSRQDPNDLRYQRAVSSVDRGLRTDVRLRFGDPATRGWTTELTASASLSEQASSTQELVTRDIFPLTGARRDTIAPGVFGRSEYLGQLAVDGRPRNLYLRLETRGDWSANGWRHLPLLGVEVRHDANSGSGRQFDPLRPPRQNYGVGDRPNSFSSIPALTQLAPYVEHRARTVIFSRPLDAAFGLRVDVIDPAAGGARHGSHVSPRTNVSWQVHPAVSLRGGYGKTVKAPTLSQLYPLPRYFDLVSFNYYPTNPDERLVLFTTRVVQPGASHLRAAASTKSEGAIDVRIGGTTATVIVFDERLTGAFGTTRVPLGMLVPKYRAESFPAGRPPVLEPAPFRVDSFVALYDEPRNTRVLHTRGIEASADAPEWRALRTQLSFGGALLRTHAIDNDVDIPVDQFIGGEQQPSRVGVYDAGRGSEALRVITSFRLVHRAPSVGLLISLLAQTTWREDDRPLGRIDGLPRGYVDRSGVITWITAEQAASPEFDALRRKVLPAEGRWERRPPLHLLNLRITKALPGRSQLALFANNALADRPLYQRQRQAGFERRNQPLFFGVEFLTAIPFTTSRQGT